MCPAEKFYQETIEQFERCSELEKLQNKRKIREMLEKLKKLVEAEKEKDLTVLEIMGVDPDLFESELDSARASAFRVSAYNDVLKYIEEIQRENKKVEALND